MEQSVSSPIFPAYLPRWLRERIGSPELQPGVVYAGMATILFADLSGFTQLTAAFAVLPDGAERLHETLNRCYTALVETIEAFEGDIASIAGDALIAWWPGHPDLELGQRCAAQMLATMAALPPVVTPTGVVRLHLRIGLSAGPVYAILAGLPRDGLHFVLCGSAINTAALAERDSARDSLLALLPPASLLPLHDPPLPAPARPLSWEYFLPPSFVERLRLGQLIAEYRRCVPVFAGFTSPSRPEDLHPLVIQVQTVVLRWGGWLNEIEIGDKGAVFVLLFGAPLARGDDSSRAIGCCLELCERGLIVRAGITLGWLFVGAVGGPQRRVYTAQGNDMNLAAHLMEQTEPGSVMISGRMRNDVLDRYRTGPTTLVVTKGHHQGVPAARVLGPLASVGLSLLPVPPPLPAEPPLHVVGRHTERRILAAAATAAAAGATTALLVEGESGIGKSVLLRALLGEWAAQGQRSFSTACSSGAWPQPLSAWRPILLALAAVELESPPAAQAAQIRQALSRLPEPLQAASPLLVRMLTGTAERLATNLTVSPAEELALLELASWLIRLQTQRGPLLLLLEDIQWADDLSLRLASALLVAEPGQLCLALSHRPMEQPPAALIELRAHPACTRVSVSRLTGDETGALIREQLGVKEIALELGRQVERHTEGQPLFIKEYLRVLRQLQLIRIERGSASLVGSTSGVQLSNSAQGIIQARVDQLDEATRLTLKVAAVLGPTVQLELLRSIHPARPDPALLNTQIATLVALQIIELELDGPAPVYRFKHGLTHEVAYASLLFGQRRELHSAVIKHYERLHQAEIAAGTAPLALYDVLIAHLGHAQAWHRRAHYGYLAARLATRQLATATALRHLEQALALSSDPDQRIELLLLRMAIYERTGSYSSQSEDLPELEALAVHDDLHSASTAYFALRRALVVGETANVPAAVFTLMRCIRRRQAAGADRAELALLAVACAETYARALAVLGYLPAAQRRLRLTLARCRAITPTEIALLSPLGIAARCQDALGTLALTLGNPHEALYCYNAAISLARQVDDWSSECRAYAQRGLVQLALDDLSAAEADARVAWTTSSAAGDRVGQALARRTLAAVAMVRGAYSEAERDTRLALALSARAGARTLEAAIWEDLACCFAAQGRTAEAESARMEARHM